MTCGARKGEQTDPVLRGCAAEEARPPCSVERPSRSVERTPSSPDLPFAPLESCGRERRDPLEGFHLVNFSDLSSRFLEHDHKDDRNENGHLWSAHQDGCRIACGLGAGGLGAGGLRGGRLWDTMDKG